MSSKGTLPDAWDDNWSNIADIPATKPTAAEPAPKLSKAQKRAQHADQQRQLWSSAENPGRNLWLEAQGVVPLKQEIKPQVTLLSRKPPATAKKDALGKPGLEDDEDSEEEARKKQEVEFAERQRKAKIEREEKQKRYAEARERIMGSSNASPSSTSRESSHGRERDNRRQRGSMVSGSRRSQPDPPAEQSPSGSGPASIDGQLFDPEDMGRKLLPRREASSAPTEDQPLRQPRGPDNTGGFALSGRGGRPGA